MENIVTLKDIAKIAKVDVSTVSRALNDSPLVRKELKEKIKKIARKLNYVPNLAGYSLRTKITRSVSLVFPFLKFPGGEFYEELIRGIDKSLEEYKFSIVLSEFSTQNIDNSSFIRIVKERRVDAGIVIGDIYSHEDLNELNKLNIPIILINQKIGTEFENIINIYSDNFKGAQLITEHLIKIHNCKNILFIGGGEKYQTNNERIKGFIETAEKYNINFQIHNGLFEFPMSAYNIIENFINEKRFDFDAIICASDSLAFSSLKCLYNHKILPDYKISVTGYDNTQNCRFYVPSLSSVDPQSYLMGSKAGELIINWILNKRKPETKRIEIEPKLIIRESCGCKEELKI